MRLLISLVCVFFLSGCHSNYRQATTDSLGYLPVGQSSDVRITVNHGVDSNQFRKTLYVSTDMAGVLDWMGYQDYVMEAFRQLNFFDEVVTRQPTLFVNTTPQTPTKIYDDKDLWFDVVDPVSLSEIARQYGPHVLVAKTLLRSKSADYGDFKSYVFQLQLIDPVTSRVLFQGSQQGTSTLGIDQNTINSVLNYAKGYLLFNDPTYVPNHNITLQEAEDLTKVDTLTTPFSYDAGKDK
jgi:hypothetical protein